MDREKFLRLMDIADDNRDLKKINETLNKSIEANLKDGNPRGHRNLIIVMEELAELQKEVSKELRGKGEYPDILQELADVQLAIYYIQNICEISDVSLNKAMNAKMMRVEETLSKNGIYL